MDSFRTDSNSFDRGVTVLVSVGIIAPIANDAYVGSKAPLDFQIAWFVIWGIVAAAVHQLARYILGKLKHV